MSDADGGVAHDVARDDSVCGVFCDAEPEVSFEAFGVTFRRCRDCYERDCSRCREPIPEGTRGSTRAKGWCEDCREEVRLLVGDPERGIQKSRGEEQATLITDGGQSDAAVAHDSRRCPECDSHGTIVDLRTGDGIGDRDKVVRSRTYLCWECDTRWERYGR